MLEKIKYKLEKNGINEYQIALKINTEVDKTNVGLDGFPIVMNIDIMFYTGLELEIATKIGEYECVLVPGFTPTDKYNNLAFMADAYSEDTLKAVKGFINEDGTIKYDFLNPNIIYIKKMYIQPEYRKKGIGSYSFYLLYGLLKDMAGVITIYPYPHEENGKNQIFEEDPMHQEFLDNMTNFLKQFSFCEKGKGIWYLDTHYKLFQ